MCSSDLAGAGAAGAGAAGAGAAGGAGDASPTRTTAGVAILPTDYVNQCAAAGIALQDLVYQSQQRALDQYDPPNTSEDAVLAKMLAGEPDTSGDAALAEALAASDLPAASRAYTGAENPFSGAENPFLGDDAKAEDPFPGDDAKAEDPLPDTSGDADLAKVLDGVLKDQAEQVQSDHEFARSLAVDPPASDEARTDYV